jgi:uncharacterized protein with von Willebrand factor type A (vWA) domain
LSGPSRAPEPLDAVAVMVGLGRALDAAGVEAGPDRVAEAVRALAELDPARRSAVYWAGRLTFCSGPEDLVRYDAVFAALFSGQRPRLRRRPVRTAVRTVPLAVDGAPPGGGEPDGGDDTPALRAAASTTEVLRHRDIAELSGPERAALNRALAAFGLPGESRPSRRWERAAYGRIDPHRTVRTLLRSGGEPYRLHRRRHTTRPRPVVLIVDISGSMSSYADALLRFAHAASRRAGTRTEVFTLGTRLTRVTRQLAVRDPEAAMRAVAELVPDWSGGTRLGALLGEFLDRWGQRGTARGAVVVILSDGWERDDARELGRQMARLSRLAHRVVWSNPRRGRPGFAPLAAGLVAALPYVDDFLDGHSLAALERLARVVVGADARTVPRSADPSGAGSGAGSDAGSGVRRNGT